MMKGKIGKNGQVNGDKGETMTSLLDSTDSDVEWLNLPPIKGKKLKKKKSSTKPRDTSLCDTWALLKVFFCVSLVGAVVLLSVTSIWLSTQLNTLRQQLKEEFLPRWLKTINLWGLLQNATLDPQEKLGVEFKSSKRMKKRRELDALVGNVKSRRKKSRNDSGHELLRSNDSESSECDDYHLPNVKKRDPGICSACTTITFILVLLCMLVCAGLIWMHLELKADLENLKMNLKTVESKSTVNSEDVMKLQGFVMHINKSLELETKTSQQLLDNITAINGTITKLSNSVKKVSAAVEAAPEIKQIPEKLKIVSTTLAQMGSDVSSLKEKVKTVDPFHKSTTAKLDNLTKQIEEIKQAAKSAAESKEALNPDLANLVQLIPQRLEDLNSTVSGQISVIMKSLSTYEERFLKLENISHSLKNSLKSSEGEENSDIPEGDYWTSDQFKTAVSDILQDMLSKMSSNGSQSLPVLPQSQSGDLMGNITDLRQRIANLEKLQSEGDKEEGSLSQDSLDDLKDSLEIQLKAMNESLNDVQMNQAHVASIVLNHSNMLNNISHQITVMQHYVSYLEQTLRQIHTQNITQTTEETPSTTLLETSTKLSQSTGTEIPKTSTSSVEVEKTTVAPSSTIVIPTIKNAEDLENGFIHWSRGHSVEQVLYEDLRGFLGPGTPDKEALDKFDEDKSGSYSLEEFSKALGIPLDEEAGSDLPESSTHTDNIPPR